MGAEDAGLQPRVGRFTPGGGRSRTSHLLAEGLGAGLAVGCRANIAGPDRYVRLGRHGMGWQGLPEAVTNAKSRGKLKCRRLD